VKLGAFGVMVVDGAEAAKYGGDLEQIPLEFTHSPRA
jgi:hypothetical protein